MDNINQSSDEDDEYSGRLIERPLYEAIEPILPAPNTTTTASNLENNKVPSDVSEDDFSEPNDDDDDEDYHQSEIDDDDDDTKDYNFDDVDESLVDAFYADVNACNNDDYDDVDNAGCEDDNSDYVVTNYEDNDSHCYVASSNSKKHNKMSSVGKNIKSNTATISPVTIKRKSIKITGQDTGAEVASKSYKIGNPIEKTSNVLASGETNRKVAKTTSTVTPTATTKTNTSKMIHAQTSDNKLVLVTIVKENGKIYVPVTKQSSLLSSSAAATASAATVKTTTAATLPPGSKQSTSSPSSVLPTGAGVVTLTTTKPSQPSTLSSSIVTLKTTSQVPKLKIISSHIGGNSTVKVGNTETKSKLSSGNTLPEIKHKKEEEKQPVEKSDIKITINKSVEKNASTQLLNVRGIIDDDLQQSSPIRSSTPLSQKSSREFIALQKSFTQSKILSEFVNDPEKMRKSRKVPLKDENDVSSSTSSLQLSNSIAGRRCKSFNRNPSTSPTVYNPLGGRTIRRSRSKSVRDDSLLSLDCSRSKGRRGRTRSKSIANDDKKSLSYNQAQTNPAQLRKSRSKSVRGENDSNCSIGSRLRRSRSKSTVNDDKTCYFPIAMSNNIKRANMRSQNADFVQKTRKFFNTVMKDEEDLSEQQQSESDALNDSKSSCEKSRDPLEIESDETPNISLSILSSSTAVNVNSAAAAALEDYLESVWQEPPKQGSDSFCWKCGKCGQLHPCSKCDRSFHGTCIKSKFDKNWTCPECIIIENVLNGQKKVKNKTILSVDLLNQLLLFALKRMKEVKGYEKFLYPPELNEFPNYSKYIINPVTLTLLQEKIEKKSYRCAEEFVSDTKWIQHNNSIFNCTNATNKDSIIAKALIKVCRQETAEIETCSECYLNANTRSDWFVDICSRPHILVWAKLKGFPYWPAKAMGPGQGALVNVRFFGDHDRAFVPVKDCYLYSEQDPNPQNTKRNSRTGILIECIKEVEIHIDKIRNKIGAFNYAPFKKCYDPSDEMRQLEEMMPGVVDYMKRQQAIQKPPLQYKIVKTAGNQMSIIKKPDSGTDSDHSSNLSAGGAGGGDRSSKVENSVKKNIDTSITITTSATIESITPKNTSFTSHSNIKNKSSGSYEVVSKANKDENNSSKINSVILKRKSNSSNTLVSSGVSKSNDNNVASVTSSVIGSMVTVNKKPKTSSGLDSTTDTNVSVNSPVDSKKDSSSLISKVDGKNNQKDPKVTPLKRKHSVAVSKKTYEKTEQNVTQPKSKQAKHDSSPPTIEQSSPKTANTQVMINDNMLETLTKNKQSLTIKKITHQNNKSPDPNISVADPEMIAKATTATTTTTTTTTTVDSLSSNISISSSITNNKKSSNPTPPSIIHELIPFEDIKIEQTEGNDLNHDSNPEPNANNCNSTIAGVIPIPLLLAEVKQEPLFDSRKNTESADQEMLILPMSTAEMNRSSLAQSTTSNSVEDRSDKVIDTSQQHRIAVRVDLLKESNSNLQSSEIPTKKITTVHRGGIPFGPLPKAAATEAVSNISNASKNNGSGSAGVDNGSSRQQQTNQRARKSFPSKSILPSSLSSGSNVAVTSSTNATVTSSNGGNNLTTTTTTTTAAATITVATSTQMQMPMPMIPSFNASDPKPSLLRNSMVSIPVDSVGEYGNRKHSIPIPPLTAVSKNTSASFAKSANCYGKSLNQSAKTSSSESSNTTSTTTATTTTTNTTTTISNINLVRITPPTYASTMSAPPPLAGLSNSLNINSPATSVAAPATNAIPNKTLLSLPLSSSLITLTTATTMTTVNDSIGVISSTTSSISEDRTAAITATTVTTTANLTTTTMAAPPKLLPGIRGALRSDTISHCFPSQAGPLSQTLAENAHKITDFFISVMKDTMADMSSNDDILQAKVALLTIELEQAKLAYEREIADLKHSTDMVLCNMKKNMEQEQSRLIADIRKQCELERLRSIDETKKKQWCANCGREAQFYCCWNTSYCDYPCQQLHWSRHITSCRQNVITNNCEISNNAANSISSRTTTSTATATPTTLTTNSLSSMPSISMSQDFGANRPGVQKLAASQHITSMSQFTMNIGSKKDKSRQKTSSPAVAAAAASSSSSPSSSSTYLNKSLAVATPEVLKLPSSTYVRAVPVISRGGGGGGGVGSCNSSNNAAPRFNVPLPITAPVNSGPAYTLINREGSWELMQQSTQATSSVSTVPTPLMSSQHYHLPPPPQPTPQSNIFHSRVHPVLPLPPPPPPPSSSMIAGSMLGMVGPRMCNALDASDPHNIMNRGAPSSGMLYTTATNCPAGPPPAYMRTNQM